MENIFYRSVGNHAGTDRPSCHSPLYYLYAISTRATRCFRTHTIAKTERQPCVRMLIGVLAKSRRYNDPRYSFDHLGPLLPRNERIEIFLRFREDIILWNDYLRNNNYFAKLQLVIFWFSFIFFFFEHNWEWKNISLSFDGIFHGILFIRLRLRLLLHNC